MSARPAENEQARSRPSLRLVIGLTLFGVALLATAVAALIARWLVARDIGALLEGIGYRPPGTIGHGMMRNRLLLEIFERTGFGAQLTSSIVYSGLAGAVVAGIIGYLGASHIAHPLSALSGRIRRLAAGDYDRSPAAPPGSTSAKRAAQSQPSGAIAEVAEMRLAIDTLAGQLAAAEGLRRRLVEDLAHELRSPLTAVRGYAEGLRDGVFPDPAHAVAGLQRELGRIERLITDLRHSALPNSPAEFWPVDLGDLASSVVGGYMPAARAKGIDLQLQVGSGGPHVVLGDTDRLSQVLGNLLDNAIKYTPAAGVVRVSVAQGQLAGGQPDEVALAVRDTGPGIPAKDLPHIFQRLYRAERSRARSTGGSGIGLAIVKQIVLAHGGTVEASNPEGGGALFVVRMRRTARPKNPAS